MPTTLPRQWSYPSQGTSVSTTTTTVTETAGAGLPGFNLAADSVQVPTLITGPANSSTAASISFNNPIQNTLGFDAVISATVIVTGASVATLTSGVGSASTGITLSPFVTNYTATTAGFFTVTAYVPTGYWFEVGASQLNGAGTAASVNAQWQPV